MLPLEACKSHLAGYFRHGYGYLDDDADAMPVFFCIASLCMWQALVFLKGLVDDGRGSGSRALDFVMHADDDSFVRLDLLAPLLVSTREECLG